MMRSLSLHPSLTLTLEDLWPSATPLLCVLSFLELRTKEDVLWPRCPCRVRIWWLSSRVCLGTVTQFLSTINTVSPSTIWSSLFLGVLPLLSFKSHREPVGSLLGSVPR